MSDITYPSPCALVPAPMHIDPEVIGPAPADIGEVISALYDSFLAYMRRFLLIA